MFDKNFWTETFFRGKLFTFARLWEEHDNYLVEISHWSYDDSEH